jgi:hypothetical protein
MAGNDASPDRPVLQDRSGRLVFFGLLAVALGGCVLLVGVANLALPILARALPQGAALASDWRSTLIGFLTYAMIGGILVWAGAGSARRRRWTPPVMLTLAWTWLILGLFLIAIAAGMLEDLLVLAGPPGEPPPPELLAVVKTVVLGILALGGLLLPAIYIWVYRDEQLLRTCERHDPRPAWTEGLPASVLGLSLVLWAAAALMLPLAVRPAVPLFGLLVTGWPGALILLGGAVGLAALARAIYRRSMAAWWATTLLLVALGASVALTFHVVESAVFLREMGLPEEYLGELPTLESGLRLVHVWGSLALTVISVAYMLAIRGSFASGPGKG